MDPLGRIPGTIVTGFLGSGKTTVLNHVLSSGKAGRVAALVNDFGAINLDAALVAEVADEVVQLTNGCICCSINGDLFKAVEKVLALSPAVDRIVTETTGLADPLPVGLTFLQTRLRERTVLESVVTVVDCANFALDLFTADAAMAQIIHADILVLNKTDLGSAEQVEAIERRVKILKPRAPVLRTAFGQVPTAAILDVPNSALFNDGNAGASGHLVRDGFSSVAVPLKTPLSGMALQAWIDRGIARGVFRAKGIVAVDEAERRFAFQYCAGRSTFDRYEGDVRQEGLVFIGQDMDREAILEGLTRCFVWNRGTVDATSDVRLPSRRLNRGRRGP